MSFQTKKSVFTNGLEIMEVKIVGILGVQALPNLLGVQALLVLELTGVTKVLDAMSMKVLGTIKQNVLFFSKERIKV